MPGSFVTVLRAGGLSAGLATVSIACWSSPPNPEPLGSTSEFRSTLIVDETFAEGLGPAWFVLHPELAEISVGSPGSPELTLTPAARTAWYNNQQAVHVYRLVAGNFAITTDVAVESRSGGPLPPGFRLGGLSIRSAAGGPVAAYHAAYGAVAPAYGQGPGFELKSTVAGVSELAFTPLPSSHGQLRLCRFGTVIEALYRATPADPWIRADLRDRPDLPDTLAAGAIAYDYNATHEVRATFFGIQLHRLDEASECASLDDLTEAETGDPTSGETASSGSAGFTGGSEASAAPDASGDSASNRDLASSGDSASSNDSASSDSASSDSASSDSASSGDPSSGDPSSNDSASSGEGTSDSPASGDGASSENPASDSSTGDGTTDPWGSSTGDGTGGHGPASGDETGSPSSSASTGEPGPGCATAYPDAPDLASLSDEFDDPQTLACWIRRDEAEGELATYTGLRIEDSALHVLPEPSGWFDGHRGPFFYKLVTGDFRLEVAVTASSLASPTLPPSLPFNSAGIVVRAPRTPESLENWVMWDVGAQYNAQPNHEGKTTVNSDSTLYITEGGFSGRIRLCRLGARIELARDTGDGFVTIQVFERPDFPDMMQVGLCATAWNGHGGSPNVTIPADLQARWEYARFSPITSPGDCTAEP